MASFLVPKRKNRYCAQVSQLQQYPAPRSGSDLVFTDDIDSLRNQQQRKYERLRAFGKLADDPAAQQFVGDTIWFPITIRQCSEWKPSVFWRDRCRPNDVQRCGLGSGASEERRRHNHGTSSCSVPKFDRRCCQRFLIHERRLFHLRFRLWEN